MDPNELRKKRIERSNLLKAGRELYGISRSKLSSHSWLSTETIDRIENGLLGWNVDSELIYMESLQFLIKEIQKRKQKA